MAGKRIPEIRNLEKIEISGDNILWCTADHILWLWFLYSMYGNIMKNLKRACDLIGTTRGHASKS